MKLIEGHRPIEPPKGVPIWDIDPYAPALLANPTAFYAEMRTLGEFVYFPKYSLLACGRHKEVKEVFGDWQRFVSSRGVGLLDFKFGDPWRPPSIILEVDPPDHSRTRKILSKALSPKVMKGVQDDLQKSADQLIDALLEKGTFDGVSDCAEVYPTTVFPGIVGLTSVDRRALVDYGSLVFNALGPDNILRRDALAMSDDIVPWITKMCLRENLTEDGIGAAIYAHAEEGTITPDEAGLLVRSLLSAGVDTTVTGIGNLLWCLARSADQFDLLKSDPSLLRPAFEEVLRLTSPVHSFCRTVNADTEVSGIKLLEGSKILCVLGAANTDPDQWQNPETFDVTRKPVGHMAMGTGIHGCVGQNLARAEVGAVLTALVQKVDRIEFAGEARWRPNNAIHALDHMPLSFR